MRSSDTAELFFDNTKVPAENLIGQKGGEYRELIEGKCMEEICRDLRAEIEEFDAVLAKLDRKMRQIVTPFYGWTIEDQIRHLVYFDDRAAIVVTNSEKFSQHHKEELGPDLAGIESHIEKIIGSRSIGELTGWWHRKRHRMIETLAAHNPKDRCPGMVRP